MPRANRIQVQGGTFHLTHRCHNRQFHLKFARDRDAYRVKMREGLREFRVSLLDYCLTSNHVHLLIDAEEKEQVSRFMQKVAGEFARSYNRRKGRTDAVWGDSFHATLIDSGEYLQRCERYIELNMVRCGVVAHPRDWEWVGYHEIVGQRQRYRLLDLDRLCWRLRAGSLADLRAGLERGLADAVARDERRREAWWTESVAVGRPDFLERIRPMILSRRELETIEPENGVWVLRELEVPYGGFLARESGAKAQNKA
jgi:putative transposase